MNLKDHGEKLTSIITRDRVIDQVLKEKIQKKKLFICERHYRPDQLLIHDSRSSVKPGEIPSLNLPQKSFQSPPNIPRLSSINAVSKRLAFNQATCSTATFTSPSYKSFDEFQNRSQALKLPPGWEIFSTPSFSKIFFMDGIHMVPKFEIYVNENLSFVFRVFLWMLPSNHGIFRDNVQSFQHMTLSTFLSSLNSYDICPGISLENTKNNNNTSLLKHIVPKIVSSLTLLSDNNFPLHQTEFNRSESCDIFNKSELHLPCNSFSSLFKNDSVLLKRKLNAIKIPAKDKAPIKFTDPEKVKLTLQNYRIEKKSLKLEIAQMKEIIALNNVR